MADIIVVPGAVVGEAGAPAREVIAGSLATAGMGVYEDGANGAKPAQADAVATAKLAGVILNGGSTGQPLKMQTGGNYNPGVAVVVGVAYVLSAAAPGGIAPYDDLVSTNVTAILGVATTTSNIKIGILNSEVART